MLISDEVTYCGENGKVVVLPVNGNGSNTEVKNRRTGTLFLESHGSPVDTGQRSSQPLNEKDWGTPWTYR